MALRADDELFVAGTPERLQLDKPRLSLIPGLMPEIELTEEAQHLSTRELFLEVSEAANGILDNYKALLFTKAYEDYYNGDPEELINHLVLSNKNGLRYETRYMPGDDNNPSYRGSIADCARIPRKRFPEGVPASLGGGVFAVETYEEEWVGNRYKEELDEQFFVVPPNLSRLWRIGGRRWDDGMIILPGQYSANDPNTLVLDGTSQARTRLPQGLSSSVILGQPCTDDNEIRRLLKLTEDICWSAQQKMAHSEFDN